MTRNSVSSTLSRVYFILAAVVVLALVSRFVDLIPGLPPPVDETGKRLYEVLRDMSLLIATGGVAYLTNVFQKRSNFVESLEEQWRSIVGTKSALYAYCETPKPTPEAYLAAFCRISETIDMMRIVYRNAGETDKLIGLYPYAPLHDMRRALQSLDPDKRADIPAAERKLVRDAILQSFYALRENFIEELDLDEPHHPLLIFGGRRLKSPGAAPTAEARQRRQQKRQAESPCPRPDIDALLTRLYEREQGTPAPNPPQIT